MLASAAAKHQEYMAKLDSWATLYEQEHGNPPTDADCHASSTWLKLKEKERYYRKHLDDDRASPARESTRRHSHCDDDSVSHRAHTHLGLDNGSGSFGRRSGSPSFGRRTRRSSLPTHLGTVNGSPSGVRRTRRSSLPIDARRRRRDNGGYSQSD